MCLHTSHQTKRCTCCGTTVPYIHQEILPKTLPYINQVITKKRFIFDSPLNFSTFRTEIFTTYLQRTCKCTPNQPFFVNVLQQLLSLFYFTEFWIGQSIRGILTNKRKIKCWHLIRNTVSTNHVKLRIVERGIANQPF